MSDCIDFLSLSSIGDRAFSGCNALASITMPASLESIGNSAFFFCRNLKTLIFKGDAPEIFEVGGRGKVKNQCSGRRKCSMAAADLSGGPNLRGETRRIFTEPKSSQFPKQS
jgi:hypothetical protein